MPAFCAVLAGAESGKRMSRTGILAEGEELSSNSLFCYFNDLQNDTNRVVYGRFCKSAGEAGSWYAVMYEVT
jgi:hypothetical protein